MKKYKWVISFVLLIVALFTIRTAIGIYNYRECDKKSIVEKFTKSEIEFMEERMGIKLNQNAKIKKLIYVGNEDFVRIELNQIEDLEKLLNEDLGIKIEKDTSQYIALPEIDVFAGSDFLQLMVPTLYKKQDSEMKSITNIYYGLVNGEETIIYETRCSLAPKIAYFKYRKIKELDSMSDYLRNI